MGRGGRESSEGFASTGRASAYVVTDLAAAIYRRVLDSAVGFRVIGELTSDPHDPGGDAGQSLSVLDPEGNLWSFGSYRGEL